MNLEPNTSQNHVSNINIMWHKLDLKLCKKLSQTQLVLKTIEEISTYLFISFYTCGNIIKTIKNTSRTHCNFLGILQEILACTGVQISQSEVNIARNSRKPKEA